MKLNKKMLKKLRKFNTRLFNLEKKMIDEAIKIDTQLIKRLKDNDDPLDDYEIEGEISFFIKGLLDPIATLNESFKDISNEKERYNWRYLYRVNHNEFFGMNFKKHPMYNDYHCWLFHCLYDHEHISWDKILDIKDIYVDLKTYYQYHNN